jgi:hypothetical protein
MERYSDLTDKEKLKISNDLGKLMETKKKVTYKTLSTLDKYKYAQGLNIAKLTNEPSAKLNSQYDSMENSIRLEEERIEQIELEKNLLDEIDPAMLAKYNKVSPLQAARFGK